MVLPTTPVVRLVSLAHQAYPPGSPEWQAAARKGFFVLMRAAAQRSRKLRLSDGDKDLTPPGDEFV